MTAPATPRQIALTAEQLAERLERRACEVTPGDEAAHDMCLEVVLDCNSALAIAAHLRESAALREERDEALLAVDRWKAVASTGAIQHATCREERDALAAALREIDAAAMAAVARSDAVSDAGGPGRDLALGYATGLNKAADIARAALARCAR